MIDGLVSGRLHGTPAQKVSQSNKPYFVAKVKAAMAGGEIVMVSVIAFSETVGRSLMALEDGDSVSLAGELRPKAWIDREGTAHPAVDMTVHTVLTAYHVKRKRQAVAKQEPPAAHEGGDDFNDELGF